MEQINWKQDYKNEFICPKCNVQGMLYDGIFKRDNKIQFRCKFCKTVQRESYDIKIEAVEDRQIKGLIWYTNHRITSFICPSCEAENMYFSGINKYGKTIFSCHSCRKPQHAFINLTNGNIRRFTDHQPLVKLFIWEDNKWDLRSINSNFNERDSEYYIINFNDIIADWFRAEVKKYIQYSCKINSSFGTIKTDLSALRSFSRYLVKENIAGFDEINRSLILDYLAQEGKGAITKLVGLRKFFRVGSARNWFAFDQDIIRNADYPKHRRGNPEPISDRVRQQIEENLHLLPEPIARMWLIGYFSAMRPAELAFLKQDCLVQEGQYWKLVWHRNKTNDYHEIPISRTIAQVVQEQQEYIQTLWGNDWDYLFCHYHNFSITELSQPKLKPVKKVLSRDRNNTLVMSIRTLIKVLNICDENGQLAKFQSKLLRPTRLTNLFEQGHDLAIVSAWAGHKQFATTSTYYTHVSCELMEKEAGHIQQALVNTNGHIISYESFPKSFWENPTAHKLDLAGTHLNTPIYGFCGQPLDEECHKFRACYTCECFVATVDKLPQYINTYSQLRAKQAKAMSAGQEVLVEQFARQADQLDKIIASLQQEAA
jgi:integrase/transcription elongation factor Elf1